MPRGKSSSATDDCGRMVDPPHTLSMGGWFWVRVDDPRPKNEIPLWPNVKVEEASDER